MKCFYHNDMDGRCAGSIVARYTGNYDLHDYFEVDYIQELPIDVIHTDEVVYLVDYSFKENSAWQLGKILDKTKNVIWCDHHTSSLTLIKDNPRLKEIKGIREEGISGAGLIYMYLLNCQLKDCPEYIQLVSDYDCWKYKFGDRTNHFKIGIDMRDFNALDYVWKLLFTESRNNISKSLLNDIIEDGKLVKKYIDMDNKEYLNNYGYESTINGLKCYVVNRKINSWIFGDKINEYPVVMIYVFNGTKYSYSIYSTNKDIDCSKIAEDFGGGGHKGAAGFSSDKLLFVKSN